MRPQTSAHATAILPAKKAIGPTQRWGIGLFLALFAVTAVGCARVKPYQRGRLAKSDMRWDGDPELLGGQRHATDYREGSAGGYGGGGGGCGCN